jgi:hypothetical protein
MGFDLNAEPPDQGEALPDLNEPQDRGTFQIHGVLPDLNEEAPNEEEPIQIDEAQQTQLAGGQQGNNLGKMSHNFISASSMSAAAQTGFNIHLINQPPNSPDMNILDLGFFASLQSLTDKTTSRNMDELIANVENEFQNYDPHDLRNVFLTLQGCLIEVMKAGGGNRYKIPHMNKERLEALGLLPRSLNCDRQL